MQQSTAFQKIPFDTQCPNHDRDQLEWLLPAPTTMKSQYPTATGNKQYKKKVGRHAACNFLKSRQIRISSYCQDNAAMGSEQLKHSWGLVLSPNTDWTRFERPHPMILAMKGVWSSRLCSACSANTQGQAFSERLPPPLF